MAFMRQRAGRPSVFATKQGTFRRVRGVEERYGRELRDLKRLINSLESDEERRMLLEGRAPPSWGVPRFREFAKKEFKASAVLRRGAATGAVVGIPSKVLFDVVSSKETRDHFPELYHKAYHEFPHHLGEVLNDERTAVAVGIVLATVGAYGLVRARQDQLDHGSWINPSPKRIKRIEKRAAGGARKRGEHGIYTTDAYALALHKWRKNPTQEQLRRALYYFRYRELETLLERNSKIREVLEKSGMPWELDHGRIVFHGKKPRSMKGLSYALSEQ